MAFVDLVIITIGSFIIAYSSDAVVERSASLARFLKVSPFIIGMVLVGTSTNLPELTIALVSSIVNHSGAISVGNVFGANVTDILLVFGLGALMYGFSAGEKSMKAARKALLLTLLVGAYIIAHSVIFGYAMGPLEGIVLLALYAWFAYSSIFGKKPKEIKFNTRLEDMDPSLIRKGKESPVAPLGVFLVALAALLVASYFVLESAINIAAEYGVSTGFMGATIVALGTTLPEMSVALQAFRKRQYEIGLGDTIGSVITNTTMVLGAGAFWSPAILPLSVFTAAIIFVPLSLLAFMFMGAVREKFSIREGIILLVVYALFIIAISYAQANPAALHV